MKLSEVDLSAYDLWSMTTRLEDGNPIATHLLWLCRKDAERFERVDALMKMAFEAGNASALTASATAKPQGVKDAAFERYRQVHGDEMPEEDWLLFEDMFAHVSAAHPTDGWRLVPVEPTEEMIRAGAKGYQNSARSSFIDGWHLALAAAPVAAEGE